MFNMIKHLLLLGLAFGCAIAGDSEKSVQQKRGASNDGWVGLSGPYGVGQPWDSSPWKGINSVADLPLDHNAGYQYGGVTQQISDWQSQHQDVHKSPPIVVTKHVVVEKPVRVPEPVPVEKLVPVPVEKIVHVPVERVVTKAVPVPVPVPHAVAVPVSQPVPLPIKHAVPVPIHQPIPIPVRQPIPYPVPVPIPYPVHHYHGPQGLISSHPGLPTLGNGIGLQGLGGIIPMIPFIGGGQAYNGIGQGVHGLGQNNLQGLGQHLQSLIGNSHIGGLYGGIGAGAVAGNGIGQYSNLINQDYNNQGHGHQGQIVAHYGAANSGAVGGYNNVADNQHYHSQRSADYSKKFNKRNKSSDDKSEKEKEKSKSEAKE